MIAAITWGLVGALANRIRGGLIYDITGIHISETLLRLAMAFCFALMVYSLHSNGVTFLMVWAAFFVGLLPGWGKWWAVDTPDKVIMCALRGVFILLPSALVLMLTRHINPLWCLAGAIMPLCYKAEWALERRCPSKAHPWRKIICVETWFGFALFFLSYVLLSYLTPTLGSIWDILDPRQPLKSIWDDIQHILNPSLAFLGSVWDDIMHALDPS